MRKSWLVKTVVPTQKKRNLTFYLDDVANKLFEIKIFYSPVLLFGSLL